jgi:hypothetical protein
MLDTTDFFYPSRPFPPPLSASTIKNIKEMTIVKPQYHLVVLQLVGWFWLHGYRTLFLPF